MRTTPGGDGEPPRRLMPAGTVIVVLAIGLGLGWLFNAQGIQKTAQTQSPGFRRDVGVFFADRIEDISSIFQLDRPREWIQDAAGREGDDDINLALPDPVIAGDSQASNDPTATTVPIEKPRFTPSRPARTWVGGDSLSITPGQQMISSFPGAAGGAVSMLSDQVDGHVATGLARPDVLNWPAYMTDSVLPQDPDILIFTVGPNDDQSLVMPDGSFLCCFGDQGWQDEYRRRVGGMMDVMTADDRIVVWPGIPIVGDGTRSDRYRLINDIYKTEAEKRPGKVVYVDIYPLFQGADGGYADYLPNGAGDLVKVRADDGIHFTTAGGDRVSEAVFAALNEAVRFRPDPAPEGGGNGTGNGGGGQ